MLGDIDMNTMLDVLSFNSKTIYQIYLFYFIPYVATKFRRFAK